MEEKGESLVGVALVSDSDHTANGCLALVHYGSLGVESQEAVALVGHLDIIYE